MPSTASHEGPSSQLSAPTSSGLLLGLKRAIASTPTYLSAIRKFVRREASAGGPSGAFALAIHPCITETIRVAESRFPGDLDFIQNFHPL